MLDNVGKLPTKSHAKSHTSAVWYSHKVSNKGRNMNLPPLPEPDGFLCQRLYYKVGDVDEHCTQPHHNKWAEDQMREYGALCRKAALEEAVKACEAFGDEYMCQSTTSEIIKEIRELLK